MRTDTGGPICFTDLLETEYKPRALINAVLIISFSVSKELMGLKVNEPG